MPLPERDVLRVGQRSWRNRPVAVATVAGLGGAICSALLVVYLVRSDAPQTAVAAKLTQPVETVGAAPSTAVAESSSPPESEKTAAAETAQKDAATDCQEQTWPYIARPCLASEKPKRGVRVISTDKLAEPVVNAVEDPPPVITNRIVRAEPSPAPAPAPRITAAATSNAPAKTTNVATSEPEATTKPDAAALQPQPETAQPPQRELSQPAQATVNMAPAAPVSPAATEEPRAPSAPPVATAAADASTPSEERPTASEKRRDKAKKAARKREAREIREAKKRRAPAEFQGDDDEQGETTGRARIVERWTEREYAVPAGDGSRQQRRVTVIRRGEAPSFVQGDDAYASWTRF